MRTNNVAEYAGLVLALREARRLGAEEIDLRLDSKLIVEQLNGRWRVKDAKLQGLFAEARRHLASFARWSATHEPRARNRAADALANLALDDPDAAAMLVAEVARRNGREPPSVGRRHALAPARTASMPVWVVWPVTRGPPGVHDGPRALSSSRRPLDRGPGSTS